MKNIVKHQFLGEIVCEENVWTGKKSLKIDGKDLMKISKNTYQTEDGQMVSLKGNSLTGMSMHIGAEVILLIEKPKWYEYVLSLSMFVFILIWGNVVSLVEILPLIGGAIGGAVSAVFAFLNLVFIRKVKKLWLKILISIGMFALTILICYLLALALISILQ